MAKTAFKTWLHLKHDSRFYWNFYSLRSVTGNVEHTENDLSHFGNGILQELKSWMRSVVGVENLS